jgi:hypothetical protein
MKLLSLVFLRKPLLCAALLFCLAFACPAAQTKTTSPAPARTNASPAQLELPKSVFIIPTAPQEGKDPFFPLSMRLFASAVVKTDGHPAAPPVVELKLNGISGTVDHRLAIVNNRTFEAEEEGAVSTSSGRVPIRCLEIKPDSVRVLVNGLERTLHLRPGS